MGSNLKPELPPNGGFMSKVLMLGALAYFGWLLVLIVVILILGFTGVL